MKILLLHSPLLGPSVWSALPPFLERQGCEALAPDLRSALSAGEGTYKKIADRMMEFISEGTILVVHSGAGALVPSIRHAAPSYLKTVVFVDAIMPHPGRAWFDTAPPGMADELRAKAIDGFAPPWPAWLPPGVLDQFLPNPETRRIMEAEAPSVPLAYLSARAPEIPRWADSLSLAYLQLSKAYLNEANEAEKLGWPVERLTAHHLGMMTQPQLVGASLLRLLARSTG